MTTAAPHTSRFTAWHLVFAVLLSVSAVVLAPAATARSGHAAAATTTDAVRIWTIHYTSHNGLDRLATVVLPAWYGPDNNPPLPLVISPHGRGGNGPGNAKYWDNMPAIGRFALINPDGMGRKMKAFSFGYPGQIDDLAKMPEFAMHALPWLRIDRARIYALGSSMGGQETLLLVARHPRLLAGAAAMDSVTNLSRRYDQLLDLACDQKCMKRWGQPVGKVLQSNLRREVGGTPEQSPAAYAARSGLSLAPAIASSGVPLQIWWSVDDQIVTDQQTQSGVMFDTLRRLNACAPVSEYVGSWAHSHEMRASELLPIALAGFGLLPADTKQLPDDVQYTPAPSCSR
jgi:pimeloyl-ACP methyl ester carboxylesterase